MKIVFSTPSTSPITLTQGSTASTTTFTTKIVHIDKFYGNSAHDANEVDFKVSPLLPNTEISIELQSADWAPFTTQRTMPPVIEPVNILY